MKMTRSLALTVALAACGADPAPVSDATVRDSAGVHIVAYGAPPVVASPLLFPSEPRYRYGSGPDDYAFGGIWRGVLLADGSAAVVDALNMEIVRIADDGGSAEILARRGDGPGELNLPQGLLALDEGGLLVHDLGHARLTHFDGAAVVREVNTQVLKRSLGVLGFDAAGQVLMKSNSYRRGFPEPWLQGHMVRFDLDAGTIDTVAAFDWVPSAPRDGPRNPFMTGGFVTAAGGSFVYMRSDTPEVVWRNPDGSPHQIVRWGAAPAYPDEEDWRRFESSLRTSLRPANPHIQTEAEFDEFMARVLSDYEVAPETPLPLVAEVFGDREGRVWLGHWTADAANGVPRYSLLAPDGAWLGEVQVPEGVRILDVAGHRVLGEFTDPLGIESVVLYDLVAADAGRDPGERS